MSRRASQKKSPNQLNNQIMKCPVFRPVYKFTRTSEDAAFNIVCDGINPTLSAFTFSLSQVPNSTDFTNLFDMYHITKIEIDWVPEYTELTDASVLSNAVNVRFNSAIDLTDSLAPASVNEVLQFQQLVSTGITKPHARKWSPTFLMGGLVPCSCWLPTTSPAERHYGLKIGVPATGVAMTFRAKVKYFVECANVN